MKLRQLRKTKAAAMSSLNGPRYTTATNLQLGRLFLPHARLYRNGQVGFWGPTMSAKFRIEVRTDPNNPEVAPYE